MTDKPTIEVFFEKLKFGSRRYIGPFTADSLKIETLHDSLADQWLVEIQGYMLAEKLEDHTRTVTISHNFSYPATWWDMFKKQYFPAPMLDRFPVRYKTETKTSKRSVTFKKYATYPHAAIAYPKMGTPVMKCYTSQPYEDVETDEASGSKTVSQWVREQIKRFLES